MYKVLGMGDMGLKIYHDISGIYCDNDISMMIIQGILFL